MLISSPEIPEPAYNNVLSLLHGQLESSSKWCISFVSYSDSFLWRSEGLDHADWAFRRFMVASGRGLSEGYGHDGPGVCLGDGQTEAERVPSQGGRGDALLRRMSLYLT